MRWWCQIVVGVGCAALAMGAEPEETPPLTGAALDAACREACVAVVERCVDNVGGVFGDIRKQCERATLRRCRAQGPEVCRRASAGFECPEGHVDCGTHCCPPERPSCASNERACCPKGYHIACGDGLCCPASRPVCARGRCYSREGR